MNRLADILEWIARRIRPKYKGTCDFPMELKSYRGKGPKVNVKRTEVTVIEDLDRHPYRYNDPRCSPANPQ